jgi:hypothetical protein
MYSTGPRSMPYAVTVADFNNDQRLDIAVANFGTNNIGIFLGTGNGSFSSQKIFSTRSSRPRSIAADDFNRDTLIDIAVANYGTNDIGIFLGDGTGNFLNWTTFSTDFDSIPYSLAIADLNHDGRLDIAVANFGTSNVGIFLGYGNGSFADQTIFNLDPNSNPNALTLTDLNNDTHIDIIVVCSNTNEVAILLGIGNGFFFLSKKYSIGSDSLPLSVVTSDFNKDNKTDIAVATYNAPSVSLFYGQGNGTFADQMIFYTSEDSHPFSIVSGDFNNDTESDIAIVNYDYNYIDLVLTYRNYSFSELTPYFITDVDDNPSALAVGDLNNDGVTDIIVTNSVNNNIKVFLANGDGSFSIYTINSSTTVSGPTAVALGDFNRDNHLDIVVSNNGDQNIYIFIGYGNGTFSKYASYPTYGFIRPATVAVGDLNNDSRLDIVVVSSSNDKISILFGYGNGAFSNQSIYSADGDLNLTAPCIADFNNDSRLDIIVLHTVSCNVGIFFGNSNGSFSYQIAFPVGFGTEARHIAIDDLNNDGQMDVVVSIYNNYAIQVRLGCGNGSFISKATYSVGSSSPPVWSTIADWNNDKRLDIITSSPESLEIVVFFGYGDGTFFQAQRYKSDYAFSPGASDSGNFNNDKLLDFVVIHNLYSTIDVFLASTSIKGIREASYATGSAPHPQAIGLGHFVCNSQLDAVIANYGLGNVGFLQGHTNGTFPVQMMLSTGVLSFPTSIAIGDLNHDTKQDIIVTNSLANNVGLFLGSGNGSFTSQRTYSTKFGSSPQAITTGDFNNDHKLDIAVVYSGDISVSTMLRSATVVLTKQQEYFTGIGSDPYAVAVGNFNNDSYCDFVAVNSGTASISIFLGLGNGTFSGPRTYEAAQGTASYAVVVVDFNNDSYLDIIIDVYHINAISIFLGVGDGTFSNPKTFSMNFSCNPQGIATGDFNSDGRMDVVATCDGSNNLGIFLGGNDSTLSDMVIYPIITDYKSEYAVVADFNNDNYSDIAVTNAFGCISIFQGYGNGSFSNEGCESTGGSSGPRRLAAVDLDKDGNMDIVTGLTGTDGICVFFGYGKIYFHSFDNPTCYRIAKGSRSYGLVVRDFNNDDQLDIAVANYGTNDITILLGFVNRKFFDPITYSTGDSSQPSDLAVADFNNDNRLDIVVCNSNINTVNAFLGEISEDFLIAPAYMIDLSSQLTSITAGDLNNDTNLDVVVTDNATNNIMVIFGSGYGTFTKQSTYSTGDNSQPCSVAVADLNNDNRLDIVVANAGNNNIGIFLADDSGAFFNQTVYSTGTGSQPYSVAVLDFNNDKQLDIAVANYGANTVSVFFGDGSGNFSNQLIFYNGFGSRPIALTVGDVNNDNMTDIVATNNGYGNINVYMKTC